MSLSWLTASLLCLVIEEEGQVEVLRAHKSRRFERWELCFWWVKVLPGHQEEVILRWNLLIAGRKLCSWGNRQKQGFCWIDQLRSWSSFVLSSASVLACSKSGGLESLFGHLNSCKREKLEHQSYCCEIKIIYLLVEFGDLLELGCSPGLEPWSSFESHLGRARSYSCVLGLLLSTGWALCVRWRRLRLRA